MSRDDLVDYFIKHTDQRLARLETKIDKLLAFKWQIVGGAALLSILVTVSIQFIQMFVWRG